LSGSKVRLHGWSDLYLNCICASRRRLGRHRRERGLTTSGRSLVSYSL
jgi:hypothetical protein